jgi:hypothetical protein
VRSAASLAAAGLGGSWPGLAWVGLGSKGRQLLYILPKVAMLLGEMPMWAAGLLLAWARLAWAAAGLGVPTLFTQGTGTIVMGAVCGSRSSICPHWVVSFPLGASVFCPWGPNCSNNSNCSNCSNCPNCPSSVPLCSAHGGPCWLVCVGLSPVLCVPCGCTGCCAVCLSLPQVHIKGGPFPSLVPILALLDR